MSYLRVLLLAAVTVTLAACYPPVTIHPVGSTVGFKSDPSLAGLWKAQPDADNQGSYYYHFLSEKDGTMFAVLVPDNYGQAKDVMMAKFKSARLRKNFGYLNVRMMKDPEHESPDQPPGTVLVLYRLEANGKLQIFMLDEDKTKDAIRAHKIAGTAGKAGTDDAVITADGATLDKIFRSPAGLALFDKPFATLTKVK